MNVHHLIKYKISKQEETLTFARNLSAGGVRFFCKEKLIRGSTVEIIINFPDSEGPLKLVSKVAWVKPLKKMEGFDVGVQFVSIDEKTQSLIKSKIVNTFKIANEDGG